MNLKSYGRNRLKLATSNCPEIGVKKYTMQQARQIQFMMAKPVGTLEADGNKKARSAIYIDQYITVKLWEIGHTCLFLPIGTKTKTA
jgi:hypothetical protein